jgi:hypothetical protein
MNEPRIFNYKLYIFSSPFGMADYNKKSKSASFRHPKSFEIERAKENFSQKTAKSLQQESYIDYYSPHQNYFFLIFRKPFKTNIFQKERFNQNTVTIHFKASLAELIDKMKEAEPSFVRYVGQYVNVI